MTSQDRFYADFSVDFIFFPLKNNYSPRQILYLFKSVVFSDLRKVYQTKTTFQVCSVFRRLVGEEHSKKKTVSSAMTAWRSVFCVLTILFGLRSHSPLSRNLHFGAGEMLDFFSCTDYIYQGSSYQRLRSPPFQLATLLIRDFKATTSRRGTLCVRGL